MPFFFILRVSAAAVLTLDFGFTRAMKERFPNVTLTLRGGIFTFELEKNLMCNYITWLLCIHDPSSRSSVCWGPCSNPYASARTGSGRDEKSGDESGEWSGGEWSGGENVYGI